MVLQSGGKHFMAAICDQECLSAWLALPCAALTGVCILLNQHWQRFATLSIWKQASEQMVAEYSSIRRRVTKWQSKLDHTSMWWVKQSYIQPWSALLSQQCKTPDACIRMFIMQHKIKGPLNSQAFCSGELKAPPALYWTCIFLTVQYRSTFYIKATAAKALYLLP